MRMREDASESYSLRVAEKVLLGFFAYATIASLVDPVPNRQRLMILGVNLISGWVIFALSGNGAKRQFRSLRNWFPCILILLAYRESGLFFTPDPTHRLDRVFEAWDKTLLHSRAVEAGLRLGTPWLQHYLEFSYLLTYPLVPLGLGSLHMAHRSGTLGEEEGARAIARFWAAVTLALMFCYLVYPLFPLTPPRSLFHDVPGPAVPSLFRKVNEWVLGQFSVQACIFPSGHVAGVTAAALAVRSALPRLGIAFLVAAASVAVATVYGRYHYSADALAGALVGVAAILLSRHRLRKGTPSGGPY